MAKSTFSKSGSPLAMQDSIKKATTELLVLTLLCERPLYVYEMVQELSQRSSNILEFNTMYTALRRLQENKYVEQSSMQLSEQNRQRIYYSITKSGYEYRNALEDVYRTMTQAIDQILDSHAEKINVEEL